MKISCVLIFFSTIFISAKGYSQADDKLNKGAYISLLMGKWEAYKKTDLDGGDGSDVTLNGRPYSVRLELEFLDKGKSYFNNGEGKLETNYVIKGDTLKIVRFKYSIIELTDSELVLKEEELMGKLVYLHKQED